MTGNVFRKEFITYNHFNSEVLDEVKILISNCLASDDKEQGRTDLTHLVTYTIDDSGSTEIDDAISLEEDNGCSKLWIHIADPANVIPFNGKIDQEALLRSTSLYFVDQFTPMLPISLTADHISLLPGRVSKAISVGVILDIDGSISSYVILKSLIKVTYQLTYAEADELIDYCPKEAQELSKLHELVEELKRHRESNGALILEQPQGKFYLDNGYVDLRIIESTCSRVLVSEMMILMGTIVATYGIERTIALPYRSQTKYNRDYVEEVNQLHEYNVACSLVKFSLPRGVTSTEPLSHSSLGLDCYVQASSPIRRYLDLLTHRQLSLSLEGSSTLSIDSVKNYITIAEKKSREWVMCTRENIRYWQIVWLQQNKEKIYTCYFIKWLNRTNKFAIVRLMDIEIDIAVNLFGTTSPDQGDGIKLKLCDVDFKLSKITFSIV